MELLALVCFGILAAGVESSYFFVGAPNQVRFQHDETVFVNVFDAVNQQITVWLEYDNKKFSEKTVTVPDERTPQELTIRVNEADVFKDVEDYAKPKFVKLVASGMGSQKETDLLLSYNTGYLVVQTDKPIYGQGQIVFFRILAMTELLRPANDIPVYVDIIDAKNRTIRRTELTRQTTLYSSQFELPRRADLGVWTIRAFYGGQYHTETRACIQVDQYENIIRVSNRLDSDEAPSYSAPHLDPNCLQRYVYKEPVTGTAMLEVFLKHDKLVYKEKIMSLLRSNLQWQHLQDGKADFIMNVSEIFNAPKVLADFPNGFPWDDGYFLELKCTVLESATGNEEVGLHDKTIFARNPYTFTFDRSLKTFRPGLAYNLQVHVQLANGSPLQYEDAHIDCYVDGVLDPNKESEANTGARGHIMASFSTSSSTKKLEFQVFIGQHPSKKISVEPYQGVNQVRIEMVEKSKKKQLQIFANAQGSGDYTGLFTMVLARGKVVWTKFESPTSQIFHPLDDVTLQKMSPMGRAIVFYVDKTTRNVVADSVKIEVDTPKCEGRGLQLQSEASEYRPGKVGTLNINGAPHMVVGLNVIDKALLLLNRENILKPDKIFKMMERHDVGCGEGGGKTSQDIFKNAGIALLTNANFENEVRDSISCDHQARKKRAAEDCYADPNCCRQGEIYAEKLLKEQEDDKTKVDLNTKCYSRAIDLIDKVNLTAKCISTYWRACLATLSEAARVGGKSEDIVIDYDTAIQDKLLGLDPGVRKNFKESWLFETATLDGDGKLAMSLFFRESITTWSIQGIGISKESGVCIANPIDVRTFLDFFIQLQLPYSAVRFEHLSVPATIFNYANEKTEVLLWFQSDSGMCSPFSKDKAPSHRAYVEANSAKTFTFLILPLQARKYEITVSAIAVYANINQGDGVEKELLVVNEGKEVTETFIACLDPLNQMRDCENAPQVFNISRIRGEETFKFQLPIPELAIPNTASAVGYITSNIMADAIEHMMSGVYELFEHPFGCGEQNIATTAPNVYALFYLKQTKRVNDAAEEKGIKHIRYGIETELRYRQADNSYAAELSRPPSTWLSAFVMKVYCQTQGAVDGVVDTDLHVTPTLNWLLTKHNNGIFFESFPVRWRKMKGQLDENGPSLTAFVAISFQECDGRAQNMMDVVNDAVNYLESLPNSTYESDPYLLAVTSYAVGLSNSGNKWRFMDILKATKKTDGDKVYWGDLTQSVGSTSGWWTYQPANAYSVETTSYALLAYLSFGLYEDSAYIVRWLISQRDGKFRFRTTQDTVVALQALTEYSILTSQTDVNLQVSLIPGDNNSPMTFNVTNDNEHVVLVANELYDRKSKDDTFRVTVKGSGSAYLAVDLKYNLPQSEAEKECSFNVSSINIYNLTDSEPLLKEVKEKRECDICQVCKKDPTDEYVDYGDEQFKTTDDDEEEDDQRDKRAANNPGKKDSGKNKPAATGAGIADQRKYCIHLSVSADDPSGMAIVKFGLQTGVSVEEEGLKAMEKNGIIEDYEMPKDNEGYINFYLHSIGQNPVDLKFRVRDKFKGDVQSRQMAKVDMYEYYRPEKTCTKFYGIHKVPGDVPLKYDCSDKAKRANCNCLQSICAKNRHRHFFKTIRTPSKWLQNRLCGFKKLADYAVAVRIDSSDYNPHDQYMYATGTVTQVIKQGKEHLRRDSEMQFIWKAVCKFPNFETGTVYYVIASNGYQKVRNGISTYLYELMEDAVVFLKPEPPYIMRTANMRMYKMMDHFVKNMRKGCQF